MITINNIHHIYIYNAESTLHGRKTIVNKMYLADMYINVTQYLQNMPQLLFIGSFVTKFLLFDILINCVFLLYKDDLRGKCI